MSGWVYIYIRYVHTFMSAFLGNCLQPAFPLPDIGTIASLSGRKKDSILFYKFTSFLYPGTIYYVDLSKTTDGTYVR